MDELPFGAWLEGTVNGRSVCVPAWPVPHGAPVAEAAPAHLPPIPAHCDNGEELRGFTQQHKLCLVHVAVKM